MTSSPQREYVTRLVQHIHTTRALLLADADGMQAAILLAEALQHTQHCTPLVLIEAEQFGAQRLRPSTIMVNGMPAGVIATLAVLDQQGIAARLCNSAELPGCHAGSVTELARCWLATLESSVRDDVTVIAIGNTTPQASATLATEFSLAFHEMLMDSTSV